MKKKQEYLYENMYDSCHEGVRALAYIEIYEMHCLYKQQPMYKKIRLLNNGDTEALRGEICLALNAHSYAVVYYSDDIVILIDEFAAYRHQLPVWSIRLMNGTNMEIAGKLLFARTLPTEKGMKLQHIRAEDIFHIRCFADVRLTRWTDD